MTLRTLRLWLWGTVAAVAGVLAGVVWLAPGRAPNPAVSATSLTPIGGEFALVDEEGKPKSWSDFRGRPVAVFFGFTQCPDICPTTLAELTALLADLGKRGDGLQVLLVSGDPERDTPPILKDYLGAFDPRIVGLTGSVAEIDRAFATFKAYRKTVPLEGGDYTIDHSAGVYLYDAAGAFAGTLDMHEDDAVKLRKVERLLAAGA